jgi:hypothetical protein
MDLRTVVDDVGEVGTVGSGEDGSGVIGSESRDRVDDPREDVVDLFGAAAGELLINPSDPAAEDQRFRRRDRDRHRFRGRLHRLVDPPA